MWGWYGLLCMYTSFDVILISHQKGSIWPQYYYTRSIYKTGSRVPFWSPYTNAHAAVLVVACYIHKSRGSQWGMSHKSIACDWRLYPCKNTRWQHGQLLTTAPWQVCAVSKHDAKTATPHHKSQPPRTTSLWVSTYILDRAKHLRGYTCSIVYHHLYKCKHTHCTSLACRRDTTSAVGCRHALIHSLQVSPGKEVCLHFSFSNFWQDFQYQRSKMDYLVLRSATTVH